MAAENNQNLLSYILHGLSGSFAQDQSNGFGKIVKKIFKKEGIFGFYKGISSTLMGNFVANFVYFLVYNLLKNLIEMPENPQIKFILCTCISGLITTTVNCPFWVIQTYQTKNQDKKSMLQVAKLLGFRKLFSGIGASYILVTNPIINFFVYENLKVLIADSQFSESYLPVLNFIAGGFGKFVATLFTYPYQLLRTQQHLHGDLSYLKTINEIIKKSGFKGLFIGLQAKLYQTVLNQAFTIMFYEEINKYLEYTINNLSDQKIAFILKIAATALICLYIQQQRKLQYRPFYYVFFIGLFVSMFSNFMFLMDQQQYKVISLGFFSIGILFYIHTIIYNLSTKKNRNQFIYIILSIVMVYILVMGKIFNPANENEFDFGALAGNGLLLTLIVLAALRYGKTSNKSYSLTVLGAVCHGLSARIMYTDDQNQNIPQSGVYFTTGIQISSYILLILGTTSHAKFQLHQQLPSPQKIKVQKRKSSSEKQEQNNKQEQQQQLQFNFQEQIKNQLQMQPQLAKNLEENITNLIKKNSSEKNFLKFQLTEESKQLSFEEIKNNEETKKCQ
ncbi:Mitochondrial carrier domain [Pseudocohnilembus persalinus]|uniref:Mitochondrial carrier domain n=1 Tax=Pseudocohnilembus persalinus TaxID=266149 RepID=A0A0V0QZV5_PSEPJ|nr:Mitochondrial carrier domain [Pseudocohnilembus persalinus]|eukprot:KRX07568.1 Mitochondrial carrier domain [Pseudocohnilembus persalinus]